MKNHLLLLIALVAAIAAHTQGGLSTVSHKGFYLSMATGPSFGNIRYNQAGTQYKVKGDALGFDIQIGGALQSNLILHATLQNKTVISPKINGVRPNDTTTVEENFFGAGLTKYTDQNFFFTGNIGIGHFMMVEPNDNGRTNPVTTTDDGFAFNVRVGKEWMLSKKWGLGGALFYARTTLNNSVSTGSEHWESDRFGIYFQATLCKSK